MNKLDDRRVEELFPPILFLFLGTFITIFYFAVHGDNLVSSDSAADLILARVLCRDGGLMSKNWFYSTELLTLDVQLIFKPCYALFPNDWHMARLLAHSILMILYIAPMIWFVKVSKIGPKGLWAVALCSFPIGYGYVITMSWSMCYVPYFFFTFITFGILLLTLRSKDKTVLYTVLIVIVSFISGMRTIRAIMQINMPLVAVAVFMLLCSAFRDRMKIAPSMIRNIDKPLLKYSVIMMISAAAGYVFNSVALLNNFHYFSQNDESYWQPFSIHSILKVISDMIASYGWHEKTKILSVEGLSSCCALLLGLAVVVSVVLLLFKYSHLLSDSEYILVLYTFAAVVISVFIFAHCDIYATWHWVTLMPFGYLCLSIAIKYLCILFKPLQKMRYGVILGALIVFISMSWIVGPYFGPGNMDNDTLIPVIEWLEENGYDRGVATFWNSNVTTELSDGRIEMWSVRGFGTMNAYEWLQETSHSELPDGNVFVLINKKEYEALDSGIEDYIVYQVPDFTVLAFDEGTDYVSIITGSYTGK